jgi:hydrogenase expression/formation protein HypE
MDKILLAHGSGGKLSHELIEKYFLPYFKNPFLELLNDQAVFDVHSRVAFTTDSYVVDPIFFPGGNIGDLAINGTVNDLSMAGAKPLYLSAGFILEEGFPIKELEDILASMKRAADKAGVIIVTGDTKVVNKGKADKIFINTSGIGVIEKPVNISANNLKIGDKIIISGAIGEHGIAVMAKREGLEFEKEIRSDTAPLNSLVADMLSASQDIHALRDPTRGGLATILKEFAISSNVGIVIYEDKIPVKDEVRGACEILGLDPLFVANEGRLIAAVSPESSEMVLKAMRKNKYGRDTEIIGEVVSEHKGTVILKTCIGGKRIIDMLMGEQLPRIC